MTYFDNGYALIIGIANYHYLTPQLPKSVRKDAFALRMLLINPIRCGYPLHQVKHLSNHEATAANMRGGFRWLAEQTDENDTVVIFFSGYGGQVDRGAQADNYLFPVDAALHNLDQTTIGETELTRLLNQIRAGRLLIIFDCGQANLVGGIKGAPGQSDLRFKSGLTEQYCAQLAAEKGRVVISTAHSTESAPVLSNGNNSLFVHYLLAALRGKAPSYDNGPLGIFDIFHFISAKIDRRRLDQHPLIRARTETDFPIARPMSVNDLRRRTPYATNSPPFKLDILSLGLQMG